MFNIIISNTVILYLEMGIGVKLDNEVLFKNWGSFLMQSDVITTGESITATNKEVGQLNAREKFHYRDPSHDIYSASAYWFWTIMFIQKI